jgi:hypothetical protein
MRLVPPGHDAGASDLLPDSCEPLKRVERFGERAIIHLPARGACRDMNGDTRYLTPRHS